MCDLYLRRVELNLKKKINFTRDFEKKNEERRGNGAFLENGRRRVLFEEERNDEGKV
jgi:hypothetical protein